VCWVRARYLCFVTFSSRKLSLYIRKKTRECGERAERERETFFEKKRKRVAYNNKQHREENSLRETLEEAPRTRERAKKAQACLPHSFLALLVDENKKHTGGTLRRDPGVFLFVRLRDKEKGREERRDDDARRRGGGKGGGKCGR